MRRVATVVAVVVLVVSIVGFVGSLLLHAFTGDYDKYGSIAVPGTGKVTLPQGEVDLFFVAYTPNSGDGGPVTIPDLKFSMDVPDGFKSPVVKEDDGSVTSVNTKEHVRVWRVQIKTAGTYTVTTDGDVDAFIDPQLSFGTGSPWPLWLSFLFGGLFVVAICGILVAQKLGDGDDADQPTLAGGSSAPAASTSAYQGLDPELQQLMAMEQADRTTATAAPAAATATMTTEPTTTTVPSTDTPEQSMARLQQLDQLQQLHASGALSDSEYDAARKRLGG